MDFDVLYVLFQFEYQPKGEVASYSKIHAIKLKFNKDLKCNRKEIIEDHFKSFLKKEKEEAWKLFSLDLILSDYSSIEKAVSNFRLCLSADWEIISKLEYKEWKEQGNSLDRPIIII